jgi:hypothetical protein
MKHRCLWMQLVLWLR